MPEIGRGYPADPTAGSCQSRVRRSRSEAETPHVVLPGKRDHVVPRSQNGLLLRLPVLVKELGPIIHHRHHLIENEPIPTAKIIVVPAPLDAVIVEAPFR